MGLKFKMKVLAVCLMAAALVGMVASTSLEKVEGVTLNVVEGEETLKEGSGVEAKCRYAGHVADAHICSYTCRRYGYGWYAYCRKSHRCSCSTSGGGSCPC